METMTTKELATALGVDVRTVRRVAQKKGFRTTLSETGGRPTLCFNEEQAAAIKSAIEKSGRGDLPSVARASTLSTQSELRNMAVKAFTQMDDSDLVQSVMYGMKEVLDRTRKHIADVEADNAALRIELDKSKKWYSIKRMEALTGAKFSWRILKRISTAQNIPIKKTFDQNYGEVNVYSVDVWLAAYGDIVGDVIGGAA